MFRDIGLEEETQMRCMHVAYHTDCCMARAQHLMGPDYSALSDIVLELNDSATTSTAGSMTQQQLVRA